MPTILQKNTTIAPHTFTVKGDRNIFEGAKEVTYLEGELNMPYSSPGRTLTFKYTLPTSQEKEKEVKILGNNNCGKLDKACIIIVGEKTSGGRRTCKTKKARRNRRRSSRRRN